MKIPESFPKTLDEHVQNLIKDEMVKNAERQMMRKSEERRYDMRHPFWREELREFIESRPQKTAADVEAEVFNGLIRDWMKKHPEAVDDPNA